MNRFALRLIVPVLLLVVWEALASGSAQAPRPSTVAETAISMLRDGDLVAGLATSLGRV
ncbi:ABC transporter permease, partial [Mesorhizobium sp. B1-1-5]